MKVAIAKARGMVSYPTNCVPFEYLLTTVHIGKTQEEISYSDMLRL